MANVTIVFPLKIHNTSKNSIAFCFVFFLGGGGGGMRTGFFGPERNRLIAFKKVCDIAIIYSSEKSQHLVSRSGFSELQDFRREVMA